MRIAIDGRTITATRSGVGVYAERIVRSLLEIDQQNEYVLFLVQPLDGLEAPNLTKVLIEGYDRMILNRWWENVLLPSYCEDLRLDAYFSPAYALPVVPRLRPLAPLLPLPRTMKRMIDPRTGPRFVVAVHDVITSVLPETFTPKMRMWQYVFNANAVRVADRILASSESTRQDILRHFGGDPDRISVVHLAVDDRYRPVTDDAILAGVREKYDLPPTFIMSLGTIEPRKNYPGLVRAYAGLPSNVRAAWPLVIVGAPGWYSDTIMEEISAVGVDTDLRFIGYAAHEDIPALYTLAGLFVFPSLYEGFGYPPLEAMACGTPVVSSNRSSLPEVVGDAGILVDPDDVRSMTGSILSALTDRELRDALRQEGLKRAGTLNAHETARKTLAIFQEVVSA